MGKVGLYVDHKMADEFIERMVGHGSVLNEDLEVHPLKLSPMLSSYKAKFKPYLKPHLENKNFHPTTSNHS